AKRIDAYILSLDSLAIYKEFDIVSAKPSKEELREVPHFGIDELTPNDYFSVERYISIYKRAKKEAQKANKDLVIVGGSVFYLKTLLDGLSPTPNFRSQTVEKVASLLQDLPGAYRLLLRIDPAFASKIQPTDRYRIEKALLIHIETGLAPSLYFKRNPPIPIIKNIPIFNIRISRQQIRQNLRMRTKKMLATGLVEEIFNIQKKYGRAIRPLKSIGAKETLKYLDGKITLQELYQEIVTHSAQLAKRQSTFIKTQFQDLFHIDPKDEELLVSFLRNGKGWDQNPLACT
ncbi:MAG: tRNA (adenosine(37)-N6)-dimethylallyltransferase MiaA, partial [Epsilonproteobacteria bacterium]|nr:tRNA (adenosine(37)-N6)-dimethylallyltransferase MiaA [Campylobacterota bacterium]